MVVLEAASRQAFGDRGQFLGDEGVENLSGEKNLRVDPPLDDEGEVLPEKVVGDVGKQMVIHDGGVLRGVY